MNPESTKNAKMIFPYPCVEMTVISLMPNDAFYIPSGDGQVRVAEPNELHLNNLQLCIDSGLGSVYQLG